MTDQEMIDYVKEFAFETTLAIPCNNPICDQYMDCCDGHEKYFSVAVNLGHTEHWMFDKVWRKECPTCRGHNPETDNKGTDCGECLNLGYIYPYELLIAFVRLPNKLWHVTLFLNKSRINCEAIARSFGGSGTPERGEFTCKDLPFEI